LEKATYFRRTWGDAYGYALVATGRAEIMVDDVVKVWDIAPFQVILEEAGGFELLLVNAHPMVIATSPAGESYNPRRAQPTRD